MDADGTLYVSGTTDGTDPATGKKPVDATTGAKVVLDNVKRTVEAAGYTMDNLVWVQIFASDLKDYADFNAVYRTYFKGPLPARAFIGAGSLLGGAAFRSDGHRQEIVRIWSRTEAPLLRGRGAFCLGPRSADYTLSDRFSRPNNFQQFGGLIYIGFF